MLIHSAFLWSYLYWTDVIEGISSEAMMLKEVCPSDTQVIIFKTPNVEGVVELHPVRFRLSCL